MLQSQLWESLNEVNSKQCLHFYHPLEIYLTHSKIDQSMFLDKQWEDIFFDTFDSEAWLFIQIIWYLSITVFFVGIYIRYVLDINNY